MSKQRLNRESRHGHAKTLAAKVAWQRLIGNRRRPTRRRQRGFFVEALEPRLLLATLVWDGDVDNLWSTPGNWAGDIAPVSGDSIVFQGSANTATIFDLPDAPSIPKITFQDDGFSVTGTTELGALDSAGIELQVLKDHTAIVTLTMTGVGGLTKTGTGRLILEPAGLVGATSSYAGSTLVQEGILSVRSGSIPPESPVVLSPAATLDTSGAATGEVVILGSLAGSGIVQTDLMSLVIGGNNLSTSFSGVFPAGSDPLQFPLEKVGTGVFTLTENVELPLSLWVSAGTVVIDGTATAGVFAQTNSVVEGQGSILGMLQMGDAILSPGGTGTGILSAESVNFVSEESVFFVQINGPKVGTEYDQLRVTSAGNALNSAELQVTLGFEPSPGQRFVILDNQSFEKFSDNDHFAGLPEGASLNVYGRELIISYQGGDGNDVVLTAPGPSIKGQKFEDINGNGVHDVDFSSSLPSIQRAALGPVVLERGDDNSTDALPLGFTLQFFGNSYTEFYINNNGNITFGGTLDEFTPDAFPQQIPIIAPFWADVDTRNIASAEVHLQSGVNDRGHAFVQIDWPGVGYFDEHADLLNDFTLYIEDDPLGDIVAFLYRDMQWTTGDASDGEGGFGGVGAQIGFDSGDGANFISFGRPANAAELERFRSRDYVFRMDEQGLPEVAEPGLNGWTIQLIDAAGRIVAEQVTSDRDLDGDGAIDPITERGLYEFNNLELGTYTVREVQQDGWVQIVPVSGTIPQRRLFWVNDTLGAIQSSRPDGSDLRTVVATSSTVEDVEVDNAGGKIYWRDDEGIKRANLNGSGLEVLFAGQAGALGLDTVHQSIYFLTPDSGFSGRVIHRMNLDGTGHALVSDPHAGTDIDIADIAVDPVRGKLYWTTTNEVDSIQRANLDGSNLETVTQGVGFGYRQIAIDSSNGFVYWSSDNASDSIQRVKVDGSDQITLISDVQLPLGFDIDIAGGKMYWTNGEGGGSIQRASLDGSEIETLIPSLDVSGATPLQGLAIGVPLPESGVEVLVAGIAGTASKVDFGNFQLATISGRVFADDDGNAQWTDGEQGLDGRTIELLDAATGEVLATTITAGRDLDGSGAIDSELERGLYSFTDVIFGNYRVRQVPDSGRIFSTPLSGEHSIIVNNSGRQFRERNFGSVAPASVEGTKYEDIDRDGVRDAEDVPLDGWTILLVGIDAAGRPVSRTTTTGDDPRTPEVEIGAYVFTDLLPGDYVVSEAIKPSWHQTFPVDSLGQPVNYNFVLGGGDALVAHNFLNYFHPTVSFAVINQTVSEGIGDVHLELRLDRALGIDLEVPLGISGTATATNDFTVSTSKVVIPAGHTSGVVTVSIVDDLLNELPETVVLTIQSTPNFMLGETPEHTLTINDNDPLPQVSFTSASQSVREVATTLNVGLRLSEVSGRDVTVPLTFSGSARLSSDYSLPNQTTVVIPAGQLTGSLPITIIDDTIAELVETIQVGIGAPIGAAVSTRPGTAVQHSITIDDDDAVLVSFVGFQRTVREDVGSVRITAVLQGTSATEVSVPLLVSGTAVNPSDYTLSTTTLTFPAGVENAIATVDVTIVDDSLAEPTERIVVRLGTPVGALLGSRQTYTIDILDNDRPNAFFAAASSSAWENVGVAEVELRLTNPSSTSVDVRIRRTGGSASVDGFRRDFLPFPTTIRFNAGETTKSIPIPIIDDLFSEVTESIGFEIVSVAGGGVGRPNRHTFEILDNDPMLSFATSSLSIYEGGAAGTVVVNLSAKTNRDVTVRLLKSGTASTSDYTLTAVSPATLSSNGTLTIPAGLTSASIRVTAVDDTDAESPESLSLRMTTPQGALLCGDLIVWRLGLCSLRVTSPQGGLSGTAESHTTWIYDNDLFVNFTSASQTINENAGQLTITASIPAAVSLPVIAFVTMIGPFADGTGTVHGGGIPYGFPALHVLPSVIVIPAGQTTGSLSLRVLDNPRRNADQVVSVFINSVQGGLLGRSLVHRATIRDTDAPRNVGINAAQAGQVAIAEVPTPITINPSTGPVVSAGSSPLASCVAGQICGISFSDGYLTGSTVFLDANRNGVLDFLDLNGNGLQDEGEPDEPSGVTAADGGVSLEIDSLFDLDGNGIFDEVDGVLVGTGGVDTSTGLPLAFPLTGYFNTPAISPLTTLLTALVEHHGFTVNTAAERVASAFRLLNADFVHRDALAGIRAGDPDAPFVFATQAMLHNTFTQLAATLAGTVDAPPLHILADAVVRDFADKIAEEESELDLQSAEMIDALLRGGLIRMGGILPEDVLSGAAQVITAGNQQLGEVTVENSDDFLVGIVRHQVVAQGNVSQDLQALAAGMRTVSEVVAENTGSALRDQVSDAVVGVIIPPTLAVSDVAIFEGDGNTSELTFSVYISEPPTQTVTVDYETSDHTATVADGDYQPTSGTLTWNAGDGEPKTFTVIVHGDTKFEPTELLAVILTNPSNAVLTKDIGFGALINDDALRVTSPAASGTTDTILRRTGDLLEILQNNEVVVTQLGWSPAPLTIVGADNEIDTLLIDLLDGNPLPAGGLVFHGGEGGQNTARLLGGHFLSIIHELTNATDGVTMLTSADAETPLAVEWSGVESFALEVGSVIDMTFRLPSATSSGELEIAGDGTDIVIRHGGLERFRTPASNIDRVNMVGSDGDDTFDIANLDAIYSGLVAIDARGGNDRLRLIGSGHNLDLTQMMEVGNIQGVEVIDITGDGDNTLRLNVDEVLNISPTTRTLRVVFNDGDSVIYGEGWKADIPRIVGEQYLHILTQGGATVEVANTLAFQNPLQPLDTNRDGSVSPVDALIIINKIASDGSGVLLTPTSLEGMTEFFYFDTNADGSVAPIDVLVVINFLNSPSRTGEGEVGFELLPVYHTRGVFGDVDSPSPSLNLPTNDWQPVKVSKADIAVVPKYELPNTGVAAGTATAIEAYLNGLRRASNYADILDDLLQDGDAELWDTWLG